MKRDGIPSYIVEKLATRSRDGGLRVLPDRLELVDFSSNDYLGFARSPSVKAKLLRDYKETSAHAKQEPLLGSTGSRLLSGNSELATTTEAIIARHHLGEAALLFNCGYAANLGVMASIPHRHDVVVYDELCHASIRDGIRLSLAKSFSFRHNDPSHLESRIRHLRAVNIGKELYIVVESVYSVDGDIAPLEDICAIATKYDAYVILDEAHSTGIHGPKGSGLAVAMGLQDQALIRVHTFGKAIGAHGAAVVGQQELIDFLVNFARPFMYSTALAPHSLLTICAAYEQLLLSDLEREKLWQNLAYFSGVVRQLDLTIQPSPIQTLRVGGNKATKEAAALLQSRGLDVRPILAPTVPLGSERLRIVLHSFNTEAEIDELGSGLRELLTSELVVAG